MVSEFYNEDGALLDLLDRTGRLFNICASNVELGPNKNRYQVLAKSGHLFKKGDKKKEGLRLISVSADCYTLYVEYLKTGAEFRYNEASRKI